MWPIAYKYICRPRQNFLETWFWILKNLYNGSYQLKYTTMNSYHMNNYLRIDRYSSNHQNRRTYALNILSASVQGFCSFSPFIFTRNINKVYNDWSVLASIQVLIQHLEGTNLSKADLFSSSNLHNSTFNHTTCK